MKISFVVGNPARGGGERVQNLLIDEFFSKGHEIILYTWETIWEEYKSRVPYTVNILKKAPIGISGKLLAFKELKECLKDDFPDCLIVFSLELAEIAVFSAHVNNISIILTERCDPYVLPKSLVHRMLRNIAFSLSDGVVFQTEEVRNFFNKRIQRKSIVIQNPIIDDNLPNIVYSDVLKEIVAVGRLSNEKNYEMLIRAYAAVYDKISDYKLRIYGSGPDYEYLYNLVDQLDLKSKVFLMGNVDRVVDHICKSDIFVMSSDHEGMPNALIEAMAVGLSCISTDVRSGGAKALISHGYNGLLVPVGNQHALENAILELATNRTLASQVKRNARLIRITNAKERILPIWLDFVSSCIHRTAHGK